MDVRRQKLVSMAELLVLGEDAASRSRREEEVVFEIHSDDEQRRGRRCGPARTAGLVNNAG